MIIPCPKCGCLVSDKANVCPNCGYALRSAESPNPIPESTKPDVPATPEPAAETVPTAPAPAPAPEIVPEQPQVTPIPPVQQTPPPLQEPPVKQVPPIQQPASMVSGPGDNWYNTPEPPKKSGKGGIIAAIVTTAIVLLIAGFFFVRHQNNPVTQLGKVPMLMDKQNYDQALSLCDNAASSFSSLKNKDRMTLARYYQQLAKATGKESEHQSFLNYIQTLFDSQDTELLDFLDKDFPDEINHLRLVKAQQVYAMGKVGNARDLCQTVAKYADYLAFQDKCNLASLLAAIGQVEKNVSLIQKASVIYNNTLAFNREEANRIYAENNARFKFKIDQAIKKGLKDEPVQETVTYSPAAPDTPIRSVIITGTDVRLRKGPGLNYDPIKDFYGKNIHPKKGQRLEYLGETEDFYNVRFKEYDVWVSKAFSLPSNDSPTN